MIRLTSPGSTVQTNAKTVGRSGRVPVVAAVVLDGAETAAAGAVAGDVVWVWGGEDGGEDGEEEGGDAHGWGFGFWGFRGFGVVLVECADDERGNWGTWERCAEGYLYTLYTLYVFLVG